VDMSCFIAITFYTNNRRMQNQTERKVSTKTT